MNEILTIGAGLLVGALVGVTGVGGGSIMTPLLIFGFDIKPVIAIGTDLLFAGFTKLSGTLKTAKDRNIDWLIVGRLSIGSIPASFITLWMMNQLGLSSEPVESTIRCLLGLALLLTAAATIYKNSRSSTLSKKDLISSYPIRVTHVNPTLTIILGATIGGLVTLTSVGAGAIGVSALLILYPMLQMKRVIAADIAYAVPLTLLAGMGHAAMGSVDFKLLALLLTGSIPGIWLGSQLVNQLPEQLIRTILSSCLALTGLKLISI